MSDNREHLDRRPVIAIASDHHGKDLKPALKEAIEKLDGEWLDLGPHGENSVDYPEYAHQVVEAVNTNRAHYGVLICGSGIGMSMVANRDENIRAALCHEEETVKLTRQHNDANVLVLAARSTSPEEAGKFIETFLTTDFEGGRHQRRIDKFLRKDI